MSKRDFLIDSFIALSAKKGVAAAGVDSIAAYADVSKKTIYNQFGSKEALAIEALRKFSHDLQISWSQEWSDISDPKELLLARFTTLETLISTQQFCGCIFLNVCTEYPDPKHELHLIAKRHKDASLEEMKKRIVNLGILDDTVALHIELIYEGLISRLIVNQDTELLKQTKNLVLSVISLNGGSKL